MRIIKSKFNRNHGGNRSILRTRPFLMSGLASVFLFITAAAGLVAVNAQTIGPNDVHIVDLYIDDRVQVLPSRATTVGELLERAGVTLRPGDLVDPVVEAPITNDDFQITVHRARPYVLIDGGEQLRILSAYQDPALILRTAGIEVFDQDIVGVSALTEGDQSELALNLSLDRASVYSLNLYGEVIELRSQSDQLDQILADNNITIASDDNISFEGSDIVVARTGTLIETVREPIAFDTITTDDPTLDLGVFRTTKEGVEGERLVTYEIELENEQEAGRQTLSEAVVSQPISAERLRGTKPPQISGNVSGDKEFWLAAAGIPQADWGYAEEIIGHESSWNPNAINPGSGACGLPQALPCSKLGPDWNDPVVALRWAHNYALSYGSWAAAHQFKFCGGECYSPRTNTTVFKPSSNLWW